MRRRAGSAIRRGNESARRLIVAQRTACYRTQEVECFELEKF